MGPEMMAEFRRQAERFGTEFITDDVTRVDFSERPFRVWVEGEEYRARSVIVATGASARWLGLESEERLKGRGVSACATCDGASSGTSTSSWSAAATRRSRRRPSSRASAQGHARPSPERVPGLEDHDRPGPRQREDRAQDAVRRRRGARRRTRSAGSGCATPRPARRRRSTPARSSSPSATTRTRSSSSTSSTTTRTATSIAKPGTTETNIPGVFAAGDVQDHVYRQAVTAAGTGCMAALDAERFLAADEGHGGTALTAPRPEAEPTKV